MARRKVVSLGLLGLVTVVITVTAFSLTQNLTYYLFPTEAIEQRTDFPDGKRFRIHGLVVDGTIEHTSESINFVVTDGGADVGVELTGSPPALFNDGAPVLVEGAWDGPVFRADNAFIRHSENYEVPENEYDLPEEGGGYPDG